MSGETVEHVVLGVSLAVVIVNVAAETALRNFRWSRLEELLGEGDDLARIETILKEERRILDGLIALRLFASFILLLALMGFFSPQGAVGLVVDPWGFFGNLAVALAVFMVGIYGIVRGIVRAVPERSLLLLLRPSQMVASALAPLIWLTNLVGRVACRALGLERRDLEEEARHEILDAVSEGERGGAIDDDRREMIENILDVQDQEVSQIMTPRTSVFALEIGTPLAEAVRSVVEQGHSRVPVHQGSIDNVQGILYAKDLLAWWNGAATAEPPSLSQVMRPPLFVPETKKTVDLLSLLRRNQIHMAIVLDEYGGMSGLVTIEDILEEIVGEIKDEYDHLESADEPVVRKLTEKEAEVAGIVHIDELNDALDLTIPEGESYDTLAGFISTQLGRVPEPGEVCDFDNVRFEIIDADARRINRVKVVVGE